jgi:hypothetical protein
VREFLKPVQTQEFQYTQINTRVKAQSPFIWPYCIIELNPVADIDISLTLVINPGHLKDKNPVRFDQALNDSCRFELRILIVNLFD